MLGSAGSPASLRHCIFEGSRDMALLEDYAFFALGMLEYYDLSHNPEHLRTALELAERICLSFGAEGGGYYLSAHNAENLIKRPLEIFDSAIPSGNSAAAVLFDLCFRLTGDIKWRQHRDGLLYFIFSRTGEAAWGCCYALIAQLSRVYPCRELVCAAAGDDIPSMLKTVIAKYAPELSVLLKTADNAEALAELCEYSYLTYGETYCYALDLSKPLSSADLEGFDFENIWTFRDGKPIQQVFVH